MAPHVSLVIARPEAERRVEAIQYLPWIASQTLLTTAADKSSYALQ